MLLKDLHKVLNGPNEVFLHRVYLFYHVLSKGVQFQVTGVLGTHQARDMFYFVLHLASQLADTDDFGDHVGLPVKL